MYDASEVLELATLTGEVLLRCGAEIPRVEQTVSRVAEHYGMEGLEYYIIADCIFASLPEAGQRIREVPDSSPDLSKISLVNELSRQIAQGVHTPAEALDRLREIQRQPLGPALWRTLMAALGSASFCYLFGGTFLDSLGALLCGFVLYAFLVALEGRRLSKVLRYSFGGWLVTLLSVVLQRCFWVQNLDMAIIGSIIPMIPGVAFVNGVRHIADGDYLSGSIRLLDTLVVFISIAAGVGFALWMTGAAGQGVSL